VGAGPSGLAALARISGRGIPCVGLDRGDRVGGKWGAQDSPVWPTLRTNTSRRQTRFPDVPVPGRGTFVLGTDLQTHLEDFAAAHGLVPLIRFGCEATGATPQDGGGWLLETTSGPLHARALVIAVGVHDRPRLPELPGRPTIPVEHASRFREPAAFAGRRVMVVGFGTSAAEIAAELAHAGAQVHLAVRTPGQLLPTSILGVPLDWLDSPVASRVPWWVQRSALAGLGRIGRGTLPEGVPQATRRTFHQQPTLSTRLPALLRAGRVRIAAAPRSIDGDAVEGSDGRRTVVDHVFLATGYEPSTSLLPSDPFGVGGARLPLYRRIVPPAHRDVFLVGAVEPLGGLLPVVDAQAHWTARVLSGDIELPTPEAMLADVRRDDRWLRRRFGDDERRLLLCDRHPYRRRLERDVRGTPPWLRRRLRPLAGIKAV
jgi:dimethylaniline monooxygenase (N-oxide forming)